MKQCNGQRHVDTVVIGGGLAGLTAGAILARHRREVVVVDQRAAGGRARTTTVDGFRLNQGPHALYTAGRACRIFEGLDIHPTGGRPGTDAGVAWHGDTAHRLPTSPIELLRSRLLGTRSKIAAMRILPVLRRGRHRGASGRSLAEWMDHVRAPSDVRAIIEMYVRLSTYSNTPETFCAEAALGQLRLAMAGVLYLDDGWSQLVDALAAAFSTAGGRLLVGETVDELVREGRRWTLRVGDHGEVSADTVILATGGPHAATRLAGEDPGWTEQAGPPIAAACLDLGLAAEPAVPILLSTGAPLYGSVHAPPANLAPDGRSLVGVIRYLSPAEEHDRDQTERDLEDHAARMGVQSGDVMTSRYLHRMVVAHGTPLFDRRRPTGHELAARQLWVAGDWVGPARDGGAPSLLADAAVASAADAAAAILGSCGTTR